VKNGRLVALGKQIRRLREEKGVSQEAFAALADLDRAYFGGIERGERNVAALNLIKIAVALEVEVGELFPPQPGRHRSERAADGR
jgi:transcriptional regulator with XRE-family HTH domain